MFISPQEELTSNAIAISAFVEPLAVITSDGEIKEGTENGEQITIELTEGTFKTSVSIDSISFSDLPSGVGISNLSLISDKLLLLNLSGNRNVDYDIDIDGIIVQMQAGIFESYQGSLVAFPSALIFNAFNEQLTIQHKEGLTEENLNGAVLDLILTEDIFMNENLSITNITLYNAPIGTSIAEFNYLDSIHAQLKLTFDGTDFTTDIVDFFVELNESELYSIENLVSNSLFIDEGVGINNELTELDIKIFSFYETVFVSLEKLPLSWEKALIGIFDSKGTRVYHASLLKNKVNKVDLNVETGYYFVHVSINGTEFVNKVFILPE